MYRLFFSIIMASLFAVSASAQLSLPRESQRQDLSQVVGDGKISVTYNRPNVKGRKIWGGLVPYGEVWRAGANENTVVEFSRDVTVNGQSLKAGKYGFHVLPAETDWTLIFSNAATEWGSFTYDQKKDALRLKVKPTTTPFLESLRYSIDDVTVTGAKLTLSWETLSASVAVDFGDVHGRAVAEVEKVAAWTLTDVQKNPKGYVQQLMQGANYLLTFKLANYYEKGVAWTRMAAESGPTFQMLSVQSRLLAGLGKKKEAIEAGDKAVAIGKAQTPPANTADFEKFLNELKSPK